MPSRATVADLLSDARERLVATDDPLFDSQLLLATVLEKDRSFLYAHPEFRPSDEQVSRYRELVAGRARGVPVAYLSGNREFWSLELQVDPATLIPRPETETLVEQCLQRIPRDARWPLLDLGTGSGAIALALASERPGCTVTGTDRIPEAVALASGNARRLGFGNLRFLQSDWFGALAGERFRLIACNPPYIAEGDPHLERGDVAHEPRSALVSGADGLDDIRRIVASARQHLEPGGWLLLEHGFEQQHKILDLLRSNGYDDCMGYPDLANQPRVAAAHNPD